MTQALYEHINNNKKKIHFYTVPDAEDRTHNEQAKGKQNKKTKAKIQN
jgi:hypothetical protein